jgi:hypothetical protein
MAKTLTTANSAFTLAARGIFPVPFRLEGYATDDSFAVDDVTPGEIQMGVDGFLSAGYIPYVTQITFMFQATSPSIAYLDSIIAQQKAQREMVIFDGTGFLQGTEQKYAMTNGYLISFTPANTGKKVLQPRKFTFAFQNFDPAPI